MRRSYSAPYTVAYDSDARVSYITGSRTGTTRNYLVLDVKVGCGTDTTASAGPLSLASSKLFAPPQAQTEPVYYRCLGYYGWVPDGTIAGQTGGYPYFGWYGYPRRTEAALAPGKLAKRVQLRDRYDQRMTRRALARCATLSIRCSQPHQERIRRTFRTAPRHGLDSAYLRMVLRASWRYARRGRRGARILNKTIPFFTRRHRMPFSGRRSGCAWLFPRRTTRSRQRPYRILGRVRDGRTHPNKRQGDWACSTWEPSSGPNEECDRSRGR